MEDGACGQISGEPGRPIQAEGGSICLKLRREKNNRRRVWMGVGEAHSSEEAGDCWWSEGALGKECRVRSEENRLAKTPTTEHGQHTEAAGKTVRGSGLADKLSQLRQKLGQKAKQEPRFRF